MAHTKRHRKHSSRRHRKYGHRGGFNPLSPATFSASPSTATTSNNSIQPPYNAMGPVSSNTNVGNLFRTGALDQSHINPNIINAARAGQALIEQEGGSPIMVGQHGGVWNKMVGDAIAPLVLLGLQQYYAPRNKSKMNKKMRKGKMTQKYRK
jgi:hypothetical protein